MALNWSGQNTGGTSAMQQYGTGGYGNTAGWGYQTPTGMTQQWRPSGSGATGLSNIGGSQIGLSRPQMSPAPPVYPQMSSAYPTSKGGAPLYNRDAAQQGRDWESQHNIFQPGPGATVPMPQQLPPGATGVDGLGNPTYPQMSNNNPGGGGGGQGGVPGRDDPGSGPNYGGVGMTPGPAGHQGAQQDYYDPVTGQTIYANQQATGWQAPFPGMTSGEGGMASGVGGGSGYGMPFSLQQYMGMKPEEQAAANNYMATQMPYLQFADNQATGAQDRAQAALQFALQYGLNVEQVAIQNGISQQQLEMAKEAQRQNLNNQYAYQMMDKNRLEFEQDFQNRQNIQEQQRWGAGHVLQQQQQGHQQGMDYKQLALAQLKTEYDQAIATGNLALAQKTQEQYYNIQQQQVGQAAVDSQRQNEQYYFGQANDMTKYNLGLGWEKDKYGQGLAWEKDQFGQTMAWDKDKYGQGLAWEKDQFGQGLAWEKDKYGQDMGFKYSQLGQQGYEFDTQMGFEQQKNAQQFGLAVSDQELDWLVQTNQLDLARQQFGQGQYEFGMEHGQRQYEFDAAQRQQMAIEQARLAQAEKAANVAAVGRTLAPSAKWLRAT
jgi:hypothetical protein